ncbi:uncharacterized protein BO80DRAFT_15838 [Aspergillus ibericus CBS 121593]|uniref:Zn(II)2Cys6 transcription factor n=1 Tax=Aspergillus ibericus CBS 121593 TaxID=1448316 RepID=A0A395H6V4_9EURO|nr:hypothetical protein BO80DRAFT_15838 [Aspergillus ibericus CBS 121593]RAL03243.1 hypothetical protein BO80DRAFT_15838 [Aspergillus ibericus CBS 121593]
MMNLLEGQEMQVNPDQTLVPLGATIIPEHYPPSYQSKTPSLSISPSSPSAVSELCESAAPNPADSDYLCARESDACTLCPDDLKLLANWCSTTCRSLTPDGKNVSFWRSVIVRDAMYDSALRQSMLALSALHLAHRSDDDSLQRHDFQSAAYQHWALARAGLDDALCQHALDLPESCHPMFALCSILVVLAFGHTRLQSSISPPSALDDLCQIFQQIRGSPEVLIVLIDRVREGEMASLVSQDESGPPMPNTSALAIHTLRQLNAEHEDEDPELHAIYAQAIDDLVCCLRYVAWGSNPGMVGLSWILEIPEEFLDLVVERQPLALSILAHYCVVLYHLRKQWWMGNRGIQALQEICETLGRDRISTIHWALDSTGISLTGDFI